MVKILVIEDDSQLTKLYETIFTKAGMEVITAMDGVAGLQKAFDDKPDVIVLDIMLPAMDGETVLRSLREDERGKTVPVILMTNLHYLQHEDSKDLAQEFLIKANTDPESLLAIVKKYVTL